MKKLLLLSLFALLSTLSYSQSYVVRGKVLSAEDSTAMAGATIMTPDGLRNTMCDKEGSFVLGGLARKTDSLNVVFLGYSTLRLKIAITRGVTNLGTLYLTESENEIDAVVVNAEAPMSIQKGDTTQFNAAAFKTSPDADADDLIMKVPGIVIQDGKVEAQGEPIRKIYVDGKLFFGTDPMAALKNLPADAVESIQLFDEQSEQSRLTGFDDGELLKAINIVTKTKSRTTTIFKSELSGGADVDAPNRERYLAGGNFSHFTEKQRITVTGLTNNVNTMRFGQGDDSGTDSNGNNNNQSAGVRKINGVGLNYSADTRRLDFAGSYVFDNRKEESMRNSVTNYFAREGKYDSRQSYNNSLSNSTNDTHTLNFRLEWKVTDRDVFLLSPRVNLQSYDIRSLGSALSIQDGDSLNRNRTLSKTINNNLGVSGEMMWTHRFVKPGRSLSANVNYNLSNRQSDRKQEDEYRQNYKNDTWTDSKPNNRYYEQLVDGNTIRLRLTYAEPFAKHHRVQFNYILSRDWGGTDKESMKWDEATGDYTEKDIRQSNDFKRDYNSMGAGVGYSFGVKKYKLSAGVDYLRLDQKFDEYEPNESKTKATFNDIQPNVSFRYSLDKSKYLRFRYQGRTILPRIEQMQNVINDNSPSNLRIGNPDLKEGYRHNVTLFYNVSNVVRSTNFTLTFDAATQSDFVASSTEVMPTDRDTTIYIRPGDSEGYTPVRGAFLVKQVNLDGYVSARMSATYSFAIRPIRSNMNLSVNYNYIRNPSIYTALNYANIHSGSLRVGLTSNISESVDFNFYSNTAFNQTMNTVRENTSYINQNLYYSINVIFWRNFVLNSLFTWKYYTSSGVSSFSNSFYLWNIGVGKLLFKRRNGEFRITAYDLLNQNRNLLHYVRDNAVEDVRTNSMGRYVLARFTYRFNSLSHSKPKKGVHMGGENATNISVKTLKKMSNTQKQK